MKKLLYLNPNLNIRAEIEEDTRVGFYLYVWDLKTERLIADHLQDSLEIVLAQAEDEYQIPKNAWITKSS